ncbi:MULTISPECIES: cbb3-type cytochrome c oxidase subunit I [Halomicrobium]|uniref:Cytochrome c oxidase subunit I n=2 Tax=Halomicrobium mukohataei TaxID=57705 RepID=C7P138_HALMD|nr:MULTISPECIES: cbb3-type cytochrome c oxidase subunit I [Halomicrobium]ACV49053.1 cytochrome c oxidase subunit I [Halomicrobium mukohataei DSM 12286]QCD64473.1 cytochrome-c oxidase [Halomicrobium mukohataei]QFR19279.1 cytochrome-c oxidase [Halomicrobium sp. ZPS1]
MTDRRPGVLSPWLTTLDHRDIGRYYLLFGALSGVWGGTDALAVRTELLSPAVDLWPPGTYDAFFTTHGVTMLFFFATPVAFGFANYLVPLLIGADDMAFPRVNATAFWLLPPALVLARAGTVGHLLGVGWLAPPATGWTMYPPLSVEGPGLGFDFLLLGLHLAGVSTILSAVNLIVTIVMERESVTWATLDIYSWSMLTTAGLVLFAFPVLGSTLLMLLLDRHVGTVFFATDGGGPILFQHLFWFFGHPEVYILILPAMGLISHILPRFAGRRLFGFRYVVYSTLAIGVLSFGVWAHHMFTTGIDPRLQASFMAVSLAIAVPSAVKTFNWITTLWNGRVRLTAPMLFCLAAVSLFVLGGVTGVFLASIPVDLVLHGTAFVVGHFHLLLVGTITTALFAASYYWFPLIVGRWYDPGLARAHFWLTAVGTVLAFCPLLVAGALGLPRRMATYPADFAVWHTIATVGAYIIATGQLLWLLNVVTAVRNGELVENCPVPRSIDHEWRTRDDTSRD